METEVFSWLSLRRAWHGHSDQSEKAGYSPFPNLRISKILQGLACGKDLHQLESQVHSLASQFDQELKMDHLILIQMACFQSFRELP